MKLKWGRLTENDLKTMKDHNQGQTTTMKRLKETLRTMQEKLIPLMRFQSAHEQLMKSSWKKQSNVLRT